MENLGQLKTSQWEYLRDCADRLEKAWKQAATVDLAQFLPVPGNPLRALALVEMIKTDLEMRWGRGQIIGLETYLEKLPELGGPRNLPASLVFEEYRIRQVHGDRPSIEVYRNRFPDQFAELQRLAREQPPLGTPSPAVMPAKAAPASPNPPTPDTNPAGKIIGRGYKLIDRLGRGGFAEVWRAEAPGGVEVAIKVMFQAMDHAEARREFQSLDLIKGLRHPYLLQTHSYWVDDEQLYIAMELAEGSLRARLKECRQAGFSGIPVPELLNYLKESAEAMDFLHSNKVQHRDIKPDNILHVQRHAKVADYGLARLMETIRLASASNSGTPAYMAPEMWAGKTHEHTDQCCLAVTYAELRLDRRLFAAGDLVALMMEHLQGTPRLDGLPQAERDVLLKALAKEPAERYASCMAFAQALEQSIPQAALGNRPVPADPPPRQGSGPGGGDVDPGSVRLGLGESDSIGQLDSFKPDETPHDKAPRAVERPAAPKPAGAVGRNAWQRSSPRKRFGLFLGVTGALVALAGVAAILWASGIFPAEQAENAPHPEKHRPIPTDEGLPAVGSFILVPPERVSLVTGKKKAVVIQVRRKNLDGPVQVTFLDLPPGLIINPVIIPAGKSSAQTMIQANASEHPGKLRMKMVAVCGNAQAEANFELEIRKSKPVVKGSLVLVELESVSLQTGKEKSVEIRVRRTNLDGPVQVTFSDLPAGLIIKALTIPAGQDRAQTILHAKWDTSLGSHEMKMVGVCGKTRAQGVLHVAIRLAPGFTNAIGMKLVLIPAGKFIMGSPETEEDRDPKDENLHDVEITKPFYMGAYTVTQGEYEKVMGKNPSFFLARGEARTR
jgi:serine/threonine protein kinase